MWELSVPDKLAAAGNSNVGKLANVVEHKAMNLQLQLLHKVC